jgi:FixJ family two-component response regulator
MEQASDHVYLVDDDAEVLTALRRLMQSAGLPVTAFGSAQSFLEDYDPDAPACLVLDLSMPGINGLELQRQLQARRHAPAIVFLTGRGDIAASVQAMKHGAADFLTKPVDDDLLLATVRQALARQQHAFAAHAECEAFVSRVAALTQRQREVLDQILAGRLNKQIAADLGITEPTVKLHRGLIMARLGTRSVAQLARLAERASLGRETTD